MEQACLHDFKEWCALGWKLRAYCLLDVVTISRLIIGSENDKNMGVRHAPFLKFYDVAMGNMLSDDAIFIQLIA